MVMKLGVLLNPPPSENMYLNKFVPDIRGAKLCYQDHILLLLEILQNFIKLKAGKAVHRVAYL